MCAYIGLAFIFCTFVLNVWNIFNKSADNKLGIKPVLSEFVMNVFMYLLGTLSLLSLAYIGPDPIVDLTLTGNE